MLQALLTFLPVAALLTVVPGPATALVVQSAFRGGRGEALVALQVATDLLYYSGLAWLVVRARRALTSCAWVRRVERLTGAVMVGLGFRVMLERRA